MKISLERDKVMPLDPYDVIIRPVSSEAALDKIEKENKLTFIVSIKANKHMVRNAVEKLYSVKVVSVNMMITPKGEKKAVVRLAPEYKASEIATKLGLL